MEKSLDFTIIGLSNRDKRIYESLLQLDRGSVRAVAAATGINRGSVFESVKALVKAGLVTAYDTGQQRRYHAQDPSQVLELISEQQRTLEAALTTGQQYVKALHSLHKASSVVPFAAFYEGDEGLALILRDVLATMRQQTNKLYYAISSRQVREYLYHNFANFTRERIKDDIAVQVLAVGPGGSQDALSERKWLGSQAAADLNCYTIIYGHKTALLTVNDQNVPTGVIIDNAGITSLQKLLFDQIWQQL